MTTTPDPVSPVAAPARTLSILSLIAACAAIPLGHIVVLPIAAIVLGFVARRREPEARTLSMWGIIVGFVLLFWWQPLDLFENVRRTHDTNLLR